MRAGISAIGRLRRQRLGRRAAFAALVAALAGAASAPAAAAPLYRCDGLSSAEPPLMQGLDGWFFRPTDLAELYLPSKEVLALLERLSTDLAARGTRLIMMPVPPRGLVASDRLDTSVPEEALFAPAEAAAEYRALIAALARAGVAVVDLDPGKLAAGARPGFYLARDPRWRPEGARLAATAAAAAIGPGRGDAPYRTATVGTGAVTGLLQGDVNRLCAGAVPAETVPVFNTAPPPNSGGDAAVVVAGDELVADAGANFAGFLAEAARRPVATAPAALASADGLLAYLDSSAFAVAPPPAIVWQIMAADLPRLDLVTLRRLIGAASGPCNRDGRLVAAGRAEVTGSGEILRPAPGGDRGSYVRLTFDAAAPRRFTLAVDYADGAVDAVSVEAAPTAPPTNTVAIALSEDFPAPIADIRLLGLTGPEVGVTTDLCRTRGAS